MAFRIQKSSNITNSFSYHSSGGLSPGDIITHINGREVKNSSDIYDVLGGKGKTLNMTVFRGNKIMNVNVTPEDPDD